MQQKARTVLTLALLYAHTLLAQFPGAGGGFGGGMGQNGTFYGKVVDAANGKGIGSVSVQLVSTRFNMATRKATDTLLAGQLTPSNGNFSLENIPVMGDYKLRISAIGYKPYEEKVSFLAPEQQQKLMQAFMKMGAQQRQQSADTAKGKAPQGGRPGGNVNFMEIMKEVFGGDMSQLMNLGSKDLGNIKLEADAKELENVTVVGTKPMMQLGIDRRVFNVDRNLAATGGTGTDILRQIPTINVDIDGNVTVRNAAPTLFVDGRPTTLTLDQIPADDIQSVELITNPSAKYDASGGGAAILNIVLKKNRKPGYNGSVRAGIDSRGMPNLGGDLNVRKGKFNTSVSGAFNARKSLSWTDINTDYTGNQFTPESAIRQNIDNIGTGFFAFGRAGTDYLIDNRNTLTLTFNFFRGQFNTDEINQMRYDTFFNPVKTLIGERNTDGERAFRNLGATLAFKHNFAKPGHEFTADVNINQSKNWGVSDFVNEMFTSAGVPINRPLIQRTDAGGGSTFAVAQADYANPISKLIKLETGLRAQIRTFDSYNDNLLFDYNTNDFVLLPNVSANFEFTDRVYAAYGTITGKTKENGKLGYNVGLRLESSDYDGTVKETNQAFRVQFPVSLFPSAFLSYKLTDKSDLQANYTRRINRPSFFQLIPFIDFTDPLNLSVGNAGLRPEFTNSFETNYSYQFNNNHTLLVSGYFKHTTDLLTRYQYKDINTITKDSAIYNSWENANSSSRYGLEATSNHKFTKRFDMIANINLYNANINSENLEQDLNNSQTSFYSKLTLTYKAGKKNNWVLQANADYQSRTVIPVGGGGGFRGPFMGNGPAGSNGFVNPNYGMDVSIRKDIIKNKNGQGYQGSLTLSMNDVFRTRIYDITTSSDFFFQNLARRRDPQVLRLQFNWRFGKMDTSLFKRKNMKGEMEGMREGMQGGM